MNPKIQFTNLADFQKMQGFLRNKIPIEYHLSESDAWALVEACDNLPSQVKAAITSDHLVQIFALAATEQTPNGFVVLGLPQ